MKEVDRIVEMTVEEAVKLREALREEIRSADRRAAAVPRLGEFAESWMRSKAVALKPSTARAYADVLDLHVLPALGDFYVDKLTQEDMRRWQADVAMQLSPGTANKALRVVRTLLGDAAVAFGLPRSPADRVRALPVRRFTEDEPNCLTADELRAVLWALREVAPQHYPLALTLALTGLRFGEASALKWSDIDEAAGVIRVVRAHWCGKVSTTKTGVARTVPLPAELAAVLRDHRAGLVARQARGLADGWVFPSAVGGLHEPSVLRKPLAAALRRAGIGMRFTVHGFRRTFNNLARQVAGEIVTRAITGHVTPAMTEHYSHVGVEEKRDAVGKVVRLVLGG